MGRKWDRSLAANGPRAAPLAQATSDEQLPNRLTIFVSPDSLESTARRQI